MPLTFNKFRSFVEAVAEKKHDLGADTLKILLTNTLPVNTQTQKSDLTEIATGNGYSAGGVTVVQSASLQTAGVYKLTITDGLLTASGGTIGPFRYAVLYNDTSASDLLIGWWDYGSSITLANGESVTFDFDASAGVLTIS